MTLVGSVKSGLRILRAYLREIRTCHRSLILNSLTRRESKILQWYSIQGFIVQLDYSIAVAIDESRLNRGLPLIKKICMAVIAVH
jgi:hypothetical protein